MRKIVTIRNVTKKKGKNNENKREKNICYGNAYYVCHDKYVYTTNECSGSRKKATTIQLNATRKSMYVGQKITLKVKKVKPAKASKAVSWKSSNKKVATVNSKGKVTAKKAGTAKITATSKTNKKVKAVCKITVTNKVTKITFFDCRSLKTLGLGNFDTGNVVEMRGMFYFCDNLETLDVSNFNTSNVTSMAQMFQACKSLAEIELSNFDTHKVQNMTQMFKECEKLTTLDVSNFNTGNVTFMIEMFAGCISLTTLDISSFDTSKVGVMDMMFSGCTSLKTIDISSFDTSNASYMSNMFENTNSLEKIITPKSTGDEVTTDLPEGTWKDSKGTVYTTLPTNATESIELILEKEEA